MNSTEDMSTPVTRGELREELQQLEQRVDHRFEQVDRRFEQVDQRFEQIEQRMATKDDLQELRIAFKDELKVSLEVWAGALLARMEDQEKRLRAAAKADVEMLMNELARHTYANYEAMRAEMAALDDKYADLPDRVSRLEAIVPPGASR